MTGKRLSLWARFRIWLGLDYRCRCGAVVRSAGLAGHERIHDALREFCSAPTADDIQQALKGRRP